jgi:Tfp pilus assembly PilM family ATPase
VAVPKSDVDEHVAVLTRATLFPISTSISCFALANLYKACMPSEGAEAVVCIAHFGQQSADIVILYDDAAVYPRSVYVHAGQSNDPVKYFTESIKDVLTYYRFKLHLPDVDRICLSGVADESTRDMLDAALDVPVELWNPLEHIHGMSGRISRQLADADMNVRAGIAVSMGLALERA